MLAISSMLHLHGQAVPSCCTCRLCAPQSLDVLQIQASVSEFAREVEAEYKVTLRDGYNPDIRFMAHMWEPLR